MKNYNFGEFVTYKGKNIQIAKEKATKGNLVLAEITEGDDKGYYVFGGVAEGHLITKELFDTFKGEMKVNDVNYTNINDFVDAKLDYKIATIQEIETIFSK
jgi:hypothetical protein